jgi:hypothetical protein
MENLIKLYKAQSASDRMSCHSATANQVRLVLHTARLGGLPWLGLATCYGRLDRPLGIGSIDTPSTHRLE